MISFVEMMVSSCDWLRFLFDKGYRKSCDGWRVDRGEGSYWRSVWW